MFIGFLSEDWGEIFNTFYVKSLRVGSFPPNGVFYPGGPGLEVGYYEELTQIPYDKAYTFYSWYINEMGMKLVEAFDDDNSEEKCVLYRREYCREYDSDCHYIEVGDKYDRRLVNVRSIRHVSWCGDMGVRINDDDFGRTARFLFASGRYSDINDVSLGDDEHPAFSET